MSKVLSSSQIDEFTEKGFCRLSGGFPRSIADRTSREICGQLGVSFHRPHTWQRPFLRLEENLDGQVMEAVTPTVTAAFRQLVGRRYRPLHRLGWWPVSFPGFDEATVGSWHVEGTFHHRARLSAQGLLPLFLFSDVVAGGTLIAPGSHRLAARILHEHEPHGLSPNELSGAVREAVDVDTAEEANGEAGDVILCHPLVLHAANPNRSSNPRVMANPRVGLTRPARDRGIHLSPVEAVLREARPAA
jgi:hypothetical protein